MCISSRPILPESPSLTTAWFTSTRPTAGYNAYWRKDDDRRLFEHLLRLADGGHAIAVSGVLRHNGKECPLLNLLINAGWQTHLLHSDYSVVSKVGPKESQEVLLTNYRRLEMKPTGTCREPTEAVPA